jgi:hypothetical protein
MRDRDGTRIKFATSSIVDPANDLVRKLVYSDDVDTFLEHIQVLVAYHERERVRLFKDCRQIAYSQQEWRLLDFLYFSTVTMTTLGYGDIVPATRMARLLVMGQAILGISYLAFTLMLLWPNIHTGQRSGKPNKKESDMGNN